jgi:hypothetical protein
MIISKHFKDPKGYMLVKLTEPNSYTFDPNYTRLRLNDLIQTPSVFLFYISFQNQIIETNINWAYEEETLVYNNILQRSRW